MSYTNQDFSESLSRARIDPSEVTSVVAAWGSGSGQGKDSGPGWSKKGVTDWTGGFLLKLTDGRYAYVTGWCDYTGWGCQDGVEVTYFQHYPPISALRASVESNILPHDWDEIPADLNRWLANGAHDVYDEEYE